MPKVSICIPAYNQVNILQKLLDSILIQTYQDFEIIICDDSGTEDVKLLVEQIGVNSKLKYYKNHKNLGSPENWNETLRKAEGEYIKIMHHDDWFSGPESLSRFVDLLDSNKNSHFGFSSSFVMLGDKKWVHKATSNQLAVLNEDPRILFRGNLVGAPSATIFRKKNLLFDSNIKWLVDIEFYIRYMLSEKKKKAVYIDEPLIVTYGFEGRVSDNCSGNDVVEISEHFYVFNKIYKKYSFKNLSGLIKNLRHLYKICKKYSVNRIKKLRLKGYYGEIGLPVRLILVYIGFLTLFKKVFRVLSKA
jgi:glycosyltransferase involved in cell wall biosynthesis